MARLKPGVNPAAAQADLNPIFQTFLMNTVLKGHETESMPHITISPAGKGLDHLRRSLADPITLLQWMVGLILLMCCTNVAALLMARANSRSGEMGIRMAIGASRKRLVAQLLIENLTLACLGGALGLVFAHWGSRTLVLLLSPGGEPLPLDTYLEMRVLLFAAGLAFVTTILFGLGPSIAATRVDVISSLKESSRSGASRGVRSRMRSVLVCAQVAISLVLIAGAGLFLRTMQKLEHQDLGFNRRQLLLFGVSPSQNGYDRQRLTSFYNDLQGRIQTLPGVSSATLSHLSLISGWINNGPIAAEGHSAEKAMRPPYITIRSAHIFSRRWEFRLCSDEISTSVI